MSESAGTGNSLVESRCREVCCNGDVVGCIDGDQAQGVGITDDTNECDITLASSECQRLLPIESGQEINIASCCSSCELRSTGSECNQIIEACLLYTSDAADE